MDSCSDGSLARTLSALPTAPHRHFPLLALWRQGEGGLAELARLIQSDPALSGHILALANALNPFPERPIASLDVTTLIVVGELALRQAIIEAGPGAPGLDKTGGLAYARYRARSLAMACAAQALGEAVALAPPSELFLCGLVAGIGRLALASAFPASYPQLLALAEDSGPAALAQAEAACFGVSHPQLGAAVMAHWGFPPVFCQAVMGYPSGVPVTAVGPRARRMTALLHLASRIAELCVADDGHCAPPLAILLDAAPALELTAAQVSGAARQAARHWSARMAALTDAAAPAAAVAGLN